jgi:pyruvate carboxylase subunit B
VVAEVTGEATVKSPMPGLIISVPVREGQEVEKGDKVIILESMKMENELHSPRNGIVNHVYVEEGDSVEKDQLLATIGDPA